MIHELTSWAFATFGSDVAPWLIAFVFTQLVEVPIYGAWIAEFCGFALYKAIAIGFLMSLVTHPIVWFVLPPLYYSVVQTYLGLNPLGDQAYYGMLVVVETFAVLLEAWMLYRIGIKDSLRISFVANMSSFGLGSLLRHFYGIP